MSTLAGLDLADLSGRGSAWLERLVRDQEVGGSNPLAPTKSSYLSTVYILSARIENPNVWGSVIPAAAGYRLECRS